MADQRDEGGCDQLNLDLGEVEADGPAPQSSSSYLLQRVVSFAALKEDHLKSLIEERVRRMGVFDL